MCGQVVRGKKIRNVGGRHKWNLPNLAQSRHLSHLFQKKGANHGKRGWLDVVMPAELRLKLITVLVRGAVSSLSENLNLATSAKISLPSLWYFPPLHFLLQKGWN